MSLLFDSDGDSDVELKTNNNYAKNYNDWRKKEEFNKLKTKYNVTSYDNTSSSSSSSDEEDDNFETNEELEKEFLRTLSKLKKKDPIIYKKDTNFFKNITIDPKFSKKVPGDTKKEQPLYLNDYERKLILEKGGKLSEDEDEQPIRSYSPTYVQEQKTIKDNLKNALNEVEDEDWIGGLCVKREKTKEEQTKEESEYKKWLTGQKDELSDKNFENDLKGLKEFWNDPNLEDGEKFLRDYILNERFLEKTNSNYVPTYDEIVHDSDENLSEDEKALENQREFEFKYNFRFEEPDDEFIKRYPRTTKQSLRKTEDKRKLKRIETKERKLREKEEKREDLKKLQDLKKKEIEEKLEKLKEITGNSEVPFEGLDFDGDFDPDAHDKQMQQLFNDDFYEGEENEQKPEFPDLDEELEIERWDKDQNDEDVENPEENVKTGPHCEDDDFNMDCDYDPTTSRTVDEPKEGGRKKRRRKSKFAKVLAEPKPVFNETLNKTYQEYLDEYYKLDCEDFIGELPCRFKYRKVVPNSFGLTIEEILLAKDRELNRWCSLKKAVQHRPENVENYDVIAYQRKANNESLKRKLLPSLYVEVEEKQETIVKTNETINVSEENQNSEKIGEKENENDVKTENIGVKTKNKRKNKKKTKKINLGALQPENTETKEDSNKTLEPEMTKTEGKTRRKRKANNDMENDEKSNKKIKTNEGNVGENTKPKTEANTNKKRNKNKKQTKNNNQNPIAGISDARLTAYGIKPKKFKNKLRYSKNKN